MSSNGPPRNYFEALKTNLKSCAKGTKLRVYTYIDKLLVKHFMQDSKNGLLPFRHGIPLSQDQCFKTPEKKECLQPVPYASTVGSFLYVMLCTKLDICFEVGMVTRYQSNPRLKYWTIVKHILKYHKRMRDYVLMLQNVVIVQRVI